MRSRLGVRRRVDRGQGHRIEPDEHVRQPGGIERTGDLADDLGRRRQDLVHALDDGGLGRGATERRERARGEQAAGEPHDEDRLDRAQDAARRAVQPSTGRPGPELAGRDRARRSSPRASPIATASSTAPRTASARGIGSSVAGDVQQPRGRGRGSGARPPIAPAMPPTWGSAPVRIPARIAATRIDRPRPRRTGSPAEYRGDARTLPPAPRRARQSTVTVTGAASPNAVIV